MRPLAAAVAGALLAGACASPPADEEPAPWLTLERVLASPSLTGTSPAAPAWSPDGRWLAFLWGDAGRPRREVWLVAADGGDPRPLAGVAGEPGGVRAFAWLPDSSGVLQLRGDALVRTGLDGESERVADVAGGASTLTVSPDGRFASFLRDGDLWLVELATGALTQATHVAVPSISSNSAGRYARPEVEVGPYVWGGPSYAWSPDGRTIAVHHVDRRGMRTVPFPDYLAEETAPNPVRRGYPGDPNEARTVGLLRVDDLALTLLDLPDPTATRIVDFSWSAEGRLLIDRESDTAVDRWLHVLEPGTGELRELWHDRRETRVYTLAGSAWHPDGEHALVLGDLDERYGLYVVGPDLDTPRRLTDPDFDVLSAPQVVPGAQAVFVHTNEPSPYERHVVRVPLDGGPPARVTRLPGEHRGVASPDGTKVAVLHSDDRTPTELHLVDLEAGGEPRRVTVSPPPEFAHLPWATARYVTLPSRADGATLHARVLEPPDLDRGVRHPVLFGPVYSNTVRNRWAGRWALLQQLLVARGFLVVQVDVRGSTGHGRAFREDFLADFAGRDLEDLASAVEVVRSWPHVDPERIGVWGSSYGGTLTVYALLTRPDLFQAGVAGAAAVDPYFFGTDDVAIVRRPDTHPEIFERAAARHAANLEAPLLLIHGMQDQVVPFKTTVALSEALIRAGKDFDVAFAPGATHGWTGRPDDARYLLGKLLDHFERHLASREPTRATAR